MRVPGTRHPKLSILSVALLVAVAVANVTVTVPTSALATPRVSVSPLQGHIIRLADGVTAMQACAPSTTPGIASCDALVRTGPSVAHLVPRGVLTGAGVNQAGTVGNNGGYSPAYLQSAYNIPAMNQSGSTGVGQIVAVVDTGSNPSLVSDLATYRRNFNLGACPAGTVSPTNTGCVIQVVNQRGNVAPLPPASKSWGLEESLDIDMVSAICPSCQILVVEASQSAISDLGQAENIAVSLGATVVTNSFGSSEYPSERSDDAYFNHPGVPSVVSAGDSGYGVQFPASSPDVVAVGGTTLVQNSSSGTRNGVETAWSDGGAGCSAFEPKPSWQTDAECANRTVADVAADADPATGAWIYDSYGESGNVIVGGTSEAAPIIAAIYALAHTTQSFTGNVAQYLYTGQSALTPVTSGADGSCGSYLCDASLSVNGYNGPTGLGTPGATPDSLAAFGVVTANAGTPKKTNTISVRSVPPSGVVGTSIGLSATATSGDVVAITTDTTSSGCTVQNGAVNLVGAGTCVLDFNDPGNATYAAATQVQAAIVVVKNVNVITPTSLPSSALVGASLTIQASATSGDTVALTTGPSSVGCTLSGTTVTFTAAGTCLLDFNDPGNVAYAPAPQVQLGITVQKNANSITSGVVPSSAVVGTSLTVNASATSGDVVGVTLDPASVGCAAQSTTVTFTGAGTCLVDLDDAGNGAYLAAAQVQLSIIVQKNVNTITPGTVPTTATVGTAVTVQATATSGDVVTVATNGSSTACAVSGSVVNFTGVGTCVLTLSDPGTVAYLASSPLHLTINVTKRANVISVRGPLPSVMTRSRYTPVAVSTSGRPVTITVVSLGAFCTLRSGVVTFHNKGTCTLRFSQSASALYVAPTPVTVSLHIH